MANVIEFEATTEILTVIFKFNWDVIEWVKSHKLFGFNPKTKIWSCMPKKETISYLEALGNEVDIKGIKYTIVRKFDEYNKNKGATGTKQMLDSIVPVLEIPRLKKEYSLYEFQTYGVGFLNQGSKILGDDMGLGKTLQSISLMLFRGYKKNIIIAPAVVMYNWRRELLKYIDGLDENLIKIISGTAKKREKLVNSCVGQDEYYMVYSYDSFKIDMEKFPFLKNNKFNMVILDEAHYIKNSKHKENNRSKAVKKLNAEYKLCLTGTPFSKTPESIWSLLNFLNPTVYDKYWTWKNKFLISDDWGGIVGLNEDYREEYNAMLRKYMIRRMKKEVLTDLPDKTFTEEYFDLPDEVHKELIQGYNDGIEHLSNFFRLQKLVTEFTGKGSIRKEDEYICRQKYAENRDDFSIDFQGVYTNPTFKIMNSLIKTTIEPTDYKFADLPKVQRAIEYCEEFQAADRNLVLFTSSRIVADKLYNIIKKDFKALKIVGDTENKERDTIINKFQTGTGYVLVGTIQALGIGVNLTNSDTIVFLDKHFDITQINQAIDRIYRIGQVSEKVQIISFIYNDSLDEFIDDALRDKDNNILDILSGGEEGSSLKMGDAFFQFIKNKVE